jgi:hypothetical protein
MSNGSKTLSQGRAKMKMFNLAMAAPFAIASKAATFFLLLLSLVALAVFVGPAAAQSANPYQFKKEAFKPDGTPWTGPVNVGDIIKYVLSYKPGTTNSGPVTIDDTLSPNLKYVAPTKASDALWTWGSAPYSIGNHELYKHPGFGPSLVKVTVTGPPAPTTGTGDGTIPIPILSLNKVFGVFHHAGNPNEAKVDCWDLATLAKCGSPQPNATSGFIHTPLTPQSVVRGTTIYFLGYRPGGAVTIGCFDGSSQAACADIPLPATVIDMGALAGLVEDNTGRVFAAVNDKVFCRMLPAGTDCTGWPAAGAGIVSITTPTTPSYLLNVLYVSMEHGPSPTRLYIHHGNAVIQCININSAAVCTGWPAAGTKIANKNDGVMLSSFPQSGSSGDGGVCLWNIQGSGLTWFGSQVGCLNNSGAPISVTPTNNSTSNPGGSAAISSFRLPNSGKVFFPTHYKVGGPECFDYSGSVGVPCPGYTPPAMPFPLAFSGSQYGFALDPLDPAKCMLALGHDNMLWRFDWHTGEPGCGKKTTVTTPKIEDIYCHGTPTPATFQWNAIRVVTAGAAGTLTVTKGTGTPVTLTINSGTTNYPMPGGIGPGYDQLSFSYAPGANSPTTVDLEIGFVSDKDPQICYQAEVKSCGPVFNDAVFKGSFNGSPVNVSQRVDLGQVAGAQCSPPKVTGCLEDSKVAVTCNPNGSYTLTLSGVGSSGSDITLISQTPGVTVVPAQQPYAATTTWTLTGATPGQGITLTANATKIGGGSAPDTDLCCSGEIKITMPECPKPIDLKITKVSNPTDGRDKAFTLQVTNNSSSSVTFPPNSITVTENVPVGMNVSAIGLAPWVCAPPSGAGPIICTYSLGVTLAVGAPLLPPINVTATTTGPGPWENCATVGIGQAMGVDGNTSNNKACVTVTTPPIDCRAPMVPGPAPGVCVCPAGTTLVGRECVRQTAECRSPLVAGPVAGQCVCPAGTEQKGRECVRSIECRAPQIPNVAGTACVCREGLVQKGRECVRQIACRAPQIPNAAGTACVCSEGLVQKGRECVRQIACRAPQIPNAAGTACVCSKGLVQKGRECVRPTVCDPPAKLNRRGACECPANMVAKGKACVARERSGPTIRVVPGLGGSGGGSRDKPAAPRRGNREPVDTPGRR